MTSRNVADFCKNAMGTVFLLAGAFFVCSTLVSIRAVFADPVAPVNVQMGTVQSPRANTANSRRNSANVVSRRDDASTATTASANSARGVAARTNTSRKTVTNTNSSRSVVARTTTPARTVRNRATTNSARVSLQGNAIRGSKTTYTNTYTYLNNKLYTGNYSNIIDSTTGLISADAYNNCMESYYTCMDEICTARNAAQRRCACAGRVKAFAEAETALESANEELIKVSGELALLIANKGKDVSDAFQLTDAEKVMNCVSWQETIQKYGANSDEAIKWCNNHSIYGENGNTLSTCAKPKYCDSTGNNFGFDIANIDG